jgi:hypothetical protein
MNTVKMSNGRLTLLFLIFYLLLSPIGAQAKVVKVLAIGNSFSQDAVEQ